MTTSKCSNESNKEAVVFSHSKGGIGLMIVNHFGKIGLAGTIIVLMVIYFNPVTSEYHIITYFLAALPLLVSLMVVNFISRFAYKISICFDKDEIKFYMFRKRNAVTLRIKDIETVYANLYINFIFNDRTIRYNGVADKELVNFCQKYTSFSWGILGKFFNKY